MPRLGFEQQRVSLIDPSSLPVARANVVVPDIAGPLRRLGSDLMSVGQEQKDLEDTWKGLAGAEKQLAKDENGNWIEPKFPKGQTPAYQRGWMKGTTDNYTTSFTLDMNAQLNEIMQDDTLTPDQRRQKMDAWLAGALEGVPLQFKADLRQVAVSEVQSRKNGIAIREQEKGERLLISSLQAGIKDDVKLATADVTAGVDPTKRLQSLQSKVQTLVDLRAMDKDEANILLSGVGETVKTNAFVASMTSQIYEGTVDLNALNQYLEYLVAGAEDASSIRLDTNKIVRTPADDMGRRRPVGKEFWKLDELIKEIPDIENRRWIRQELQTKINDFTAARNANAKRSEMIDRLVTLGENQSLPSNFHPEFNEMMDEMLSDNIMDTPDGANRVASLILEARYMPASIANWMNNSVNSKDPVTAGKAFAVYSIIKNFKDSQGSQRGSSIIEDMDKDLVTKMDAMVSGIALGYPTDEVTKAIDDALKNNENLSGFKEAYSKTASGSTFDKDKSTWMSEQFSNGNGSWIRPVGMDRDFDTAYFYNFAVYRDAGKAFKLAQERVMSIYKPNDAFISGVGDGTKSIGNPEGYVPNNIMFNFDANDNKWVEDFIRAELFSIDVVDGKEGLAMDGRIVGISPEDLLSIVKSTRDVKYTGRGAGAVTTTRKMPDPFLGRTVWLEPVTTGTPNDPKFNIWVKLPDGSRQPIYIVDERGRLSRFEINPGPANRYDKLAFEHQAKIDALRGARDMKLLEIDERKNRRAEFLKYANKPNAFEKMRHELGIEQDQILKGFDESLKLLEETEGKILKDGIDPKTGKRKIDIPTLLQPRVIGKDIVIGAVKAVNDLFPDGTGGQFLYRVAAQESQLGTAKGTFRGVGDKGLFQINETKAFAEVQKQAGVKGSRVWEMNEISKRELGVDVTKVKFDDLDKPLVSALFARMHMTTMTQTLPPKDVKAQALYWKRWYNTYAPRATGTPDAFIANATKYDVGIDWAGNQSTDNITAPNVEGDNTESSPKIEGVVDLTGMGTWNFGKIEEKKGFIIHHTGGHGSAKTVMQTFKERNYPAHFIIDRNGNIYRALPDGSRGQHIKHGEGIGDGLDNSNTEGVEIIANDDEDVNQKQVSAAIRLAKKLGYKPEQIFAHGEINTHKQATEGNKVLKAIRTLASW